MSKPELEFFAANNIEWIPVAGNVPGLYERILARDSKCGAATRMLLFNPAQTHRQTVSWSMIFGKRCTFWKGRFTIFHSVKTSLRECMPACRRYQCDLRS